MFQFWSVSPLIPFDEHCCFRYQSNWQQYYTKKTLITEQMLYLLLLFAFILLMPTFFSSFLFGFITDDIDAWFWTVLNVRRVVELKRTDVAKTRTFKITIAQWGFSYSTILQSTGFNKLKLNSDYVWMLKDACRKKWFSVTKWRRSKEKKKEEDK